MRSSLVIILSTVLFICCRSQHQPDRLLNQAEQLIYSDPEQAYQLLDSISPKTLSRDLRHHFYLLKIHSAYEANLDISNYPPLLRTAEYFQYKGNNSKAGWAYLYTGIVYKENEHYERASIYLSEAKESAQVDQDSTLLFQIYYHSGELYELCHDHQASIESYRKAIQYHSSKDNANNYEMGDCLLYTQQYAKAREYYWKAETQASTMQDSADIAYLMLQIGISYSKSQNQNNAILHTQNALTYNPDPIFQKQGHLLLSDIYLHNHQLDSVRYFLEQASIAKSDPEELQAQYHKLLSGIAEQQKDYKSALIYYKQYTTDLKGYQQDKSEERIDNIVNRYQKGKWQKANYLLTRQRTILATSIIILVLLMILMITYIGILFKKRREKYLNACQMVETLQSLYQEQNQCQDKFKELLLNKLEISKKLTFISGYPHDKHQAFLKMYNEILGNLQHIELDWEELYFTINYLYDNFQQKLKATFPSLNEKEIQLCCLLRGGFRTDEIAFVIQQSVYSIHKRKTTIRKKLGMDERADILISLSDSLK